MFACPCCGETPRTAHGWIKSRLKRKEILRVRLIYVLEQARIPIRNIELTRILGVDEGQISGAIATLRAELAESPWEIHTSKDGYILRTRI